MFTTGFHNRFSQPGFMVVFHRVVSQPVFTAGFNAAGCPTSRLHSRMFAVGHRGKRPDASGPRLQVRTEHSRGCVGSSCDARPMGRAALVRQPAKGVHANGLLARFPGISLPPPNSPALLRMELCSAKHAFSAVLLITCGTAKDPACLQILANLSLHILLVSHALACLCAPRARLAG